MEKSLVELRLLSDFTEVRVDGKLLLKVPHNSGRYDELWDLLFADQVGHDFEFMKLGCRIYFGNQVGLKALFPDSDTLEATIKEYIFETNTY